MSKKRRDPKKEEFWRGAMTRFARSGLSIRTFCQNEGLRDSAFHYWKRELARREGQKKLAEQPPEFVHGVVEQRRQHEASLVIELVSGLKLRFREPPRPERLAEFVHALQSGGV